MESECSCSASCINTNWVPDLREMSSLLSIFMLSWDMSYLIKSYLLWEVTFLVTLHKFQLSPSCQHCICFIFFSLTTNMLFSFFIFAYSLSPQLECKLHDNNIFVYSGHKYSVIAGCL